MAGMSYFAHDPRSSSFQGTPRQRPVQLPTGLGREERARGCGAGAAARHVPHVYQPLLVEWTGPVSRAQVATPKVSRHTHASRIRPNLVPCPNVVLPSLKPSRARISSPEKLSARGGKYIYIHIYIYIYI